MSLFEKDTVIWIDKLMDWKDVVHLGVKMLVKQSKATQELETAILKSTAEFGAYYVLEKGIALLHAAPGNYSIKAGTSTIILPKEIIFNNQENKIAKIIITLSTPDANSHMKYIEDFAKYFMNDDFKKEILNVKDLKEFWFVIEKYK